MIAVTSHGAIRNATPAVFADARSRYERDGCLKLSGLLDDTLRALLLDGVLGAHFYERVHPGIGVEACVSPGGLTSALELMFNDQRLFELIRELTGCGPIGCFVGRVYRLVPQAGHYDSWHNDVGAGRMIALSINLGREAFQGGVLQIRREDSPLAVREIANRVPGDAILFRIDPANRRRVAPLEGPVPRTVYAGWFCSEPDFETLFKERSAARPPLSAVS